MLWEAMVRECRRRGLLPVFVDPMCQQPPLHQVGGRLFVEYSPRGHAALVRLVQQKVQPAACGPHMLCRSTA